MRKPKKTGVVASIKNFGSTLAWQDYALIAIFVVFLVFQVQLVSQFKQLPSPLYGGDFYHQLGSVNHVRYGGRPFKSFTNELSTPNYSPVYGFIVGNLLKVFPISSIQMMFYFSYVIMFFSLLIVYFFTKSLFKDKTLALIASLVFVRLPFFPVLKYREFTLFILWPLFFWALYKMLLTRKLSWALIAGVVWGVGSLSHMTFLPMVIFFMPLIFLFMYYVDFVNHKKTRFSLNVKRIKKQWHRPIVLLSVFFAIGLIIAQPYWFYPIFVYKGHVPNLEPSLRHKDYSQPRAAFGFLGRHIKNLFFNFRDGVSPFVWVLVSILMLAGTFFLLFVKKYGFRERFIVLVYLGAFLIPLHYFITLPLLGFHMDPPLMELFWYRALAMLLAPFAVLVIVQLLEKGSHIAAYIPHLLILLLVVGSISDFNYRVKHYTWYATGKQPMSPYLKDVSSWIIHNTGVEDMFIAPKEVGSAINALTGRKFLAVRGNQESFLSNVFKRQGDLAAILYGNNSELQRALLKKYNVKYLYWDYYWLRAEFQFDDKGHLTGYFDPLYIFDTPENRRFFENAGVRFRKEHMALDPATRADPLVPRWDMLVAWPPQLNVTHPWSHTLDQFLVGVQGFKANGVMIAKIFAVKT